MAVTSLTSGAPALATPIPGNERIQALDVVRGFALIGIFLMNIEFFNRPLADLGQGLPTNVAGADWLAGFLIYVLVQGKFWTMFSLLFGMGFAVMLTRAERAGRAFLVPYLRRIAALAAFGALHHIFIWGGDILFSYSVAAVGLLIVLYGKPVPILLGLAALLGIGFIPGAMGAFDVFAGLTMMGLAAIFLRSERHVSILGHRWLAFSVVLLVLATGMAAFAVLAWIQDMAPGARFGLPVGALLATLVAWLADRYHEPAEPRMRRLGVGMYVVPFLVMTLGGAVSALRPVEAPPPGGEAQVATLRAEALAAEAAGREWPDADADSKRDEAKKAAHTKPTAAEKAQDKAHDWALAKVSRERRIAEQERKVAEERRIESSGSYAEALRLRADDFAENAPNEAGFAIILVGMFLLGAWFVRSGVMEDTGAHLPMFRRLATWALPFGVGLGLAAAAIATHRTTAPGDPYQAAMGLMMLGNLPACLGYVSVIVLMLHSAGPLSRIRVLAPLGRMALTNYLTHSLVGTWFFYGYGLGHWGMGRASQVVFVAVVITLQVLFCHWWLARFRYGPMEWVWRAITYWQLPAMRREPEAMQAHAAA